MYGLIRVWLKVGVEYVCIYTYGWIDVTVHSIGIHAIYTSDVSRLPIPPPTTTTQAIVRMHPPDTTTTPLPSPLTISEWAAPLLPLTACNLDACVRDAQALAERWDDQICRWMYICVYEGEKASDRDSQPKTTTNTKQPPRPIPPRPNLHRARRPPAGGAEHQLPRTRGVGPGQWAVPAGVAMRALVPPDLRVQVCFLVVWGCDISGHICIVGTHAYYMHRLTHHPSLYPCTHT